MARNYKNEAKWSKEKYGRIEVKMDKEIVEEFKKRLKNNKITITEFFEEKLKNFLKNS